MSFRLRVTFVSVILAASALPSFSGAVRLPGGSGTNSLAANDDGSTAAVALGFAVNFFGSSSPTVFVNNNGNVTFNTAFGTFTPSGLGAGIGQPIIAPFFADVDTRAGNVVTYGTGTITDATLGWSGAADFAVEWPAVGYFSSNTDKLNSFELILVNRSDTGAGNFDIEFNYNSILWETGDASGGSGGLGGTPAAVGYSNGLSGASNVFFQLPGSLVNGALINGGPNALVTHDLNSTILGRYDFQVRGGVVTGNAPEPGSLLLLGFGLAGLGALRRKKRV